MKTGLRYAVYLELWNKVKDRVAKLRIRDIRKEKNLSPNRWTSASTAMAREAVPGAERFVFLRLKGRYPQDQVG